MIYALTRLPTLLASVWLAITLIFFAIRLLPGDAIGARLRDGQMSAEQIEIQRDLMGLTKPIWVQYVDYFADLLVGHMGVSSTYDIPVSTLIRQHLIPTLRLAVASLVAAILFGVGIGLLAEHAQIWIVFPARAVITLSISTPLFVTAILAVLLFSTTLGLFPATGTGTLSHLVLPAFVLGYHAAGAIARTTQTSIRSVRGQMFVMAARGRGLPEYAILRTHILRVTLATITTIIALQAGFLLSGTVVTEAIFARPGLGGLMLTATLQRDYPLLQGLVIISAFAYAIVILISDVFQAILDPRISR